MNGSAIGGILCTGLMIVCGILMGSPLVIFFDLTSVLIVLAGTAGMIMAVHGFGGLTDYLLGGWFHLLFSKEPVKAERCRDVISVAQTGGRGAILMATAASMIGLTQMLTNLADPTAIGPAFAVCLLTSFYAVVLNLLVFVPMSRFYNEAALTAEG